MEKIHLNITNFDTIICFRKLLLMSIQASYNSIFDVYDEHGANQYIYQYVYHYISVYINQSVYINPFLNYTNFIFLSKGPQCKWVYFLTILDLLNNTYDISAYPFVKFLFEFSQGNAEGYLHFQDWLGPWNWQQHTIFVHCFQLLGQSKPT